MAKREFVPMKIVYVQCKSATCNKCGSGFGIWEEDNHEFMCGFHRPDNEKYIGQECHCGGTYEEENYSIQYKSSSYYKVECGCGKCLQIKYDGQECSCGQMYNALGQEITHRGY